MDKMAERKIESKTEDKIERMIEKNNLPELSHQFFAIVFSTVLVPSQSDV